MKLSILGPPGSGKGTQASRIAKDLGIVHISTGDMLREAVRNKTELGQKAQTFMNSGQLVPDELIIALVQERISQKDCVKGVLLDGFPRTIPQAEKLDATSARLEFVLSLDITEDECVRRLANRASCTQCGKTYNPVTHPPKKENKCDDCGSDLIVRADDRPETVKSRLKVYREQTQPLVDYYRASLRLLPVDATLSPEGVYKQITNLLQSKIST